MTGVTQILTVFGVYILELFWPIVLGFLISGILYECIPTSWVERYLGQRNLRAIAMATVIGAILPVCCFGSLPIAVTFHRKGARLGPVLAFLVATPATSVSAIMVSWKLLGPVLTLYVTGVIVLLGMVMGLVGNLMTDIKPVAAAESSCCHGSSESKTSVPDCCHGSSETGTSVSAWPRRLVNVLKYAFVTLPKEIGLELVLGILVASLIVVVGPLRTMIQALLVGFKGYILLLAVGLMTYVCSTASVPVTHALIKSGVLPGQAVVYLIAGPITSYGTILVLRKEFGWKILLVYLSVISLFALLAGVFFDKMCVL